MAEPWLNLRQNSTDSPPPHGTPAAVICAERRGSAAAKGRRLDAVVMRCAIDGDIQVLVC